MEPFHTVSFRCPLDLVRKAKSKAILEGTSFREVLTSFLFAYVEDEAEAVKD